MTIFTIEKLHTAYVQCLKHKKNTVNALRFEIHRERELYQLLHDLKNRSYRISRHVCFVVTEPAPREIFAGTFRDRVVQHLLCNEIQQFFEKDFSEHSYANRVGKGTHLGVKKLRWHVQRGGKDRAPLYFLKMDIKRFFRSIHKETLWTILYTKIQQVPAPVQWKNEVLWIARTILFHDPATDYFFKGKSWTKQLVPKEKSLRFGDGTRGLPLGNITSQFFANVYLNGLDHFVERTLGIERYVRYVDDFVLLSEDKLLLSRAQRAIEWFLEEKRLLSICTDKTILSRTEQGIDFLGYFIKPTHTLVRQKVVRRLKKKIYETKDSDTGLFPVTMIPVLQSYKGHFGHAHSFNLSRKYF